MIKEEKLKKINQWKTKRKNKEKIHYTNKYFQK
jgi:hypothetical protein